ncbi:hypothetical protein BEWA_002820 [Theileria equi strain WA]|uniref:Uncharacterized protein n=1 Tax=Theileria equi strain WA TaxID=1537102 RepID=L0AZ98_THEEQ|nr:hypothetical protein BEWA_002820 [Theileria equi strain WA]AFZ80875.1 hypothetical protein BEWA_002820 [Theileria equi strain WA]|eukprot:XP_004830541.1 hypothetical protein BEWA_002820 [Theileria equi strain WA]
MEIFKRLGSLKEADSGWEPILRHDFISSKRGELEKLSEQTIKYRFTQWECQSLFIGAFLGHCIMSVFSEASLPLALSLYFLLSFIHLRIRRDVYTLYSNMLSHTFYMLVLSFYIFFSHKYGASMHILVMLLYSSLSYTYAWVILDRYFGLLDPFAGYSFEFMIPTLREVHGALVGTTAFLGILFSIVHLYSLTYASLVSVVFALLSRWKYTSVVRRNFKTVSREPQVLNQRYDTFPSVQSLLSFVFTLTSLIISIISCFGGNKLYVGSQDGFLSYLANNQLNFTHIRKVTAMCYLLALNLFLLLLVQFLFLIQFVFRSSPLDKLLHCRFVILGRACTDAVHNKIFKCDIYCLDAGNRVKSVETLYKKYYKGNSSRLEKNMLCIENLYLLVQEYILKTERIKSLYCFLIQKDPVDPLKTMDPLVKCRMKLEGWDRELTATIEAEKKSREEKRQALRRQLEAEILPPQDCGSFLPPKRSISIPIELSLQNSGLYPNRLSKVDNRRCKTTAIYDDLYLGDGIVDRTLFKRTELFTEPCVSPKYEDVQIDSTNRTIDSRDCLTPTEPSPVAKSEEIVIDCGESDAELDTLVEYFLARQYASDGEVEYNVQMDKECPDTPLEGEVCKSARNDTCPTDAALSQDTSPVKLNALSIDERLQNIMRKAEYGNKRKKLKFSGKRSVKNLTRFFNKAFKAESTPCSQMEYTSQDCTPVSVMDIGVDLNVQDIPLEYKNEAFIDGTSAQDSPESLIDQSAPQALASIDILDAEAEITQTNLPTYISASEVEEETPREIEFPTQDDPLTLVRTYEMSEFSRKSQRVRTSDAPIMVIPISHMHKNFYDSNLKVVHPQATSGLNFCSSGGETGRVETTENDVRSQFSTDSESIDVDPYKFINEELEAYNGHGSSDVTPSISRTESIMKDLIDDISIQDSDELESNASFNYIWGK